MMRKILRFVAIGALFAGACSDKDEFKPGASISDINDSCKSYCAKASECNKAIQPDKCEQRCQNRLNRCRADEQADTVTDLQSCAADKCGEFAVCAVGAGLECTFGL